jgi:hypothetical membrane protein
MHTRLHSRRVLAFANRYPHLGPLFWMLSLEYFIVQAVVASAWTTPYSLANNPISDLGSTTCGLFSGRYVCSPFHGLMNLAFIILGLSMVGGSLLIYHEFEHELASLIGFGFMALAGIGAVLVGVFPENTVIWMHVLGATLAFLLGNLSLVILSFILPLSPTMGWYTLASGLVALGALGLFATHNYFGLGIGGMERLATYPQTIWLIVFGIYVSAQRWRGRWHPRDKSALNPDHS